MSIEETSMFEIIELSNGEIALAKEGADTEPLVKISFSEEAKSYLDGKRLEIAKAMIETGLQLAMGMEEAELEEMEYQEVDTLH